MIVTMEIVYKPNKTVVRFHEDKNFVRGLMGPIGSGKSVACVIELILIAYAQEPDKEGLRRTRFAIIRNTYRELLDTTMATFFTWVDKETGTYSALNMTFTLEQQLPDGTTVLSEFLFRALDRPDDIKKLLSLEITAAWINEARELPKAVIDMAQGRVGRYPSRHIHTAPTWFGLIMDTNPPDVDHWWYNLFEEVRPENHSLYKQPSGISPEAENLDNLPPNYYTNMQAGKSVDWIKVYVKGEYGFIVDGKPVFPEWNDYLHSKEYIQPHINKPTTTIYVGIDFGLTPAAAIGVLTPTGQIQLIDELTTFNMGAVAFGQLLHRKLASPRYSDCSIEIFGDPAGEQRAQTDEQTPYDILRQQGIDAYPTYTNDVRIRREVVAGLLTRLEMTGQPALIIGPGAPMCRKAMSGGYKYKRVQVGGDAKFIEKPDKNQYSHIADAIQYLCLGAVGDSAVIGGYDSSKEIDYSAQDRYYQ
jgi:hypothetical protein